MSYYTIQDLQNNTTTSVFGLPSCDFVEIFEMLKQFNTDNDLSDCYISVRDYQKDEIREKTEPPIMTRYKAAIKKNKKVKKPILQPVNANLGTAYVVSFDWITHKLDNIKQINWNFYDNGYPGSIVVSKINDLFEPTEIVITVYNTDSNLSDKFFELIQEANLSKSKI